MHLDPPVAAVTAFHKATTHPRKRSLGRYSEPAGTGCWGQFCPFSPWPGSPIPDPQGRSVGAPGGGRTLLPATRGPPSREVPLPCHRGRDRGERRAAPAGRLGTGRAARRSEREERLRERRRAASRGRSLCSGSAPWAGLRRARGDKPPRLGGRPRPASARSFRAGDVRLVTCRRASPRARAPSANPRALVSAERAAPRGVAGQSLPPVEEGLPPGAGSGSLMRAGG